MIVGIDLSINSTGICFRDPSNQQLPIYKIIVPKLSKKMIAVDNIKPYRISHVTYDKIAGNISSNIRCIGEKICENIKDFQDQIEYAVIEDVAMAARGRSIIDLTLLNGYIRCLLDTMNIRYVTVTPTQWKKEVLGNGQADKELTIYHWTRFDPSMSQRMISMNCKSDDVADAYFLSCVKQK